MNPFKWFKKEPKIEKKAQSESVVWPLEPGSFLEYAMGYGGRLSASKAMNFYQTNSSVATAVDKIAEAVEQIPPVLKTDDNKFISNHPAIDLLKKPNGFRDWRSFVGALCRHYLLTHDSHIGLIGNIKSAPAEMYALKPQLVSVTAALDTFPSVYYATSGPCRGNFVRDREGKTVRFIAGPFKELYHIMGFSSRSDNTSGDSPLEAAALETRQQIKGKVHNLALLENGGRLSLVVAFKDFDGIDDDEHKQRKKRIYEDLSGASNSGKIAVISGEEVDIREVGATNKDMDYTEMEKIASKVIYLRYGIPLPLVSTDASTYNNYETAILDFYENTVLPITNILFSGLSHAILPRFKVDDMMFSYDPETIKVLMRKQLDELLKRREANIETVNEMRMLIPGREPLSEGADQLYQSATLVPIGSDLFTDDANDGT